jgi:hypothetical protein
MLGSMKILWVLIMSYNHLTGLIPATFASSNIHTFLVDHNKLSGTIDPIISGGAWPWIERGQNIVERANIKIMLVWYKIMLIIN